MVMAEECIHAAETLFQNSRPDEVTNFDSCILNVILQRKSIKSKFVPCLPNRHALWSWAYTSLSCVQGYSLLSYSFGE